MKCLHKEPERRYASAAALADDLRRFGEGRPIQARPLGWGGRLWRWGRRNPAAAALVATALALFGLALGGGLWLERQRSERRAETARQEGRESQAVEAVLEQAGALQQRGRWPEARAVLEGAPSLLDSSAPAELRSAAGQRRTTCPAGGLPVQEPHALFSLPVRRCVRGRSESGGRPRPRHRHNAARVAALAGCGRGEDADKLNEEERMRWRKQARQWLRADLALWEKMLDSGSAMAPDLAKKMLTLWQAEPDLAGLREPSALDKLSADERRECLALWDEVANVLKANGGGR